jgi:PAS domain S-box-containing protein
MNRLRLANTLSIRSKTIGIVVLVSLTVIAVGFAFLATWDIERLKADIQSNLMLDAQLIGDYCVVPLTFSDNRQATEALSRLAFLEEVEVGLLIDETGGVFASYPDTLSAIPAPDVSKSPNAIFADGHFSIAVPVAYEGRILGNIFLKANSHSLESRKRQLAWTIAGLALVLIMLSYLLAVRMQKFISEPIISLKNHFAGIAATKDYSIRVVKPSADETGDLYDGVNAMLEKIDRQDKDRTKLIHDLGESRTMLNTILNTIPQSIYWKGSDGAYLGCNKSFADMARLDGPDSIAGKTDHDLPWCKENGLDVPDDQHVISSRMARVHIVEPRSRSEGGSIWVDATKIPLFDTNGNFSALLGILEDITERKEAERRLTESEARYRYLFEQNPVPLLIYETGGLLILAANEAFLRHYGYSEAEALALHLTDLSPESEKQATVDLARRLEGQAYAGEWHHLRKDGTQITIEAHSRGFTYDGRTARIAVLADITERKLMEEALREKERQISLIYDTVVDVIFYLRIAKNGAYYFDSVNQCFLSTTGLQTSQIVGKQPQEVVPEPSLSLVLAKYREAIRTKKTVRWEEESSYPSGRVVGEVRVAPVFDDANKCVGLVGSVHDITERKRAEEALRQSEQRYKQLLESVTDYTYSVEVHNGSVGNTVHGTGCRKVTGYTPEDYATIPRLWLQMVHPDDRATVEHYADPLCEGKDVPPLEHRIIHKDGTLIWIRNTYVLKKDANGTIIGYDGLISDVTERKLAEAEIRRLNANLEDRVSRRTAQLEASNKELEAFSYSVSHDLRAPLRHASGFVDLLIRRCKAELSEKGQLYLASIADSVHQMGMLIDDLLQFSRTGRAEMRQSASDLNVILGEVMETLRRDNPDRLIEWVTDRLPRVYCDEAMLRLVWMNLLSNAVKFTRTRETAKIAVGVKDETTEFVFWVRDNGVGFDMRYAQKLFGVFQRLHAVEEFEGTGIGLANVRRIIARHDGRTWAEAEIDKGATMFFTLPKRLEVKP